MADVQVQQTPDRGGSPWVWAVVVVILVAVIAWFVFMRGDTTRVDETGIDVNITAPEAPAPAPAPEGPPPATP